MSEKTLNDLFLTTLKDVYYAEKAILRALPKMAKAAESEDLKDAFLTHRDETAGHGLLAKDASGKTCQAIKGIIEEGQEIMEDFQESDALDAGLIAAGQAIEHYEMSRYGTLRTWAQQLGMRDAERLLDQTLAEEKRTDQLLTSLAEASANPEADKAA